MNEIFDDDIAEMAFLIIDTFKRAPIIDRSANTRVVIQIKHVSV